MSINIYYKIESNFTKFEPVSVQIPVSVQTPISVPDIKPEELVRTNWSDIKSSINVIMSDDPVELVNEPIQTTDWSDVKKSMIIQNILDPSDPSYPSDPSDPSDPSYPSYPSEQIHQKSSNIVPQRHNSDNYREIRNTKTENTIQSPDFMERSMYPMSGPHEFFRRN